MKTKLPESIETIEQARVFLKDMYSNGESFHPDDSAFDVEWGDNEPDILDMMHLDHLMNQIDELENFDPRLYLLDLQLCDNDVVLANPEDKEESILYRIKNYNEVTRRCYIEPVHWEGAAKPQELVDIDELRIAH